MILDRLLPALNPVLMKKGPSVEVLGIESDSRRICPGFLFVAMEGSTVDGSLFISEALNLGAVGIISEKSWEETALLIAKDHDTASFSYIQVENALNALALLSCEFYEHPSKSMVVIGITGTNGKTSVAYLLRHILRLQGNKVGLIGTINYDYGDRVLPSTKTTPEAHHLQALLASMKHDGCSHVVMEVSSHALHQSRVLGIAYDIKVFTNLSHEHLDYHQSMEQYFRTKASFFKKYHSVDKTSVNLINIAHDWGEKLVQELSESLPLLRFGFSAQADIYAKHIQMSLYETSFAVLAENEETFVRIPLIGKFNVENALAAIAIGKVLGISMTNMVEALESMPPVPGRLELVPNARKKCVYLDYAHTPDALEHVLKSLRALTQGQLYVVFGCGGDRDRTKRKLMGEVVSQYADYAIITNDNPRSEDPLNIIKCIEEGFKTPSTYECILDRRLAIHRAMDLALDVDVVLIAGKGHETTQEVNHIFIPFDDKEVVQGY